MGRCKCANVQFQIFNKELDLESKIKNVSILTSIILNII